MRERRETIARPGRALLSKLARILLGKSLSLRRVLQNEAELSEEKNLMNAGDPHGGESQSEDLGHFDQRLRIFCLTILDVRSLLHA